MKRLLLNPSFESFRAYLKDVDTHLVDGEEIFRNKRNSISRIRHGGETFIVKHYGRPSGWRRIVYSFVRAPKGERAFLYPQVILSRGFETPLPIAYVEERKWGMLSDSYFVSGECLYARRFFEFGTADAEQCVDDIRAFARYAARLHEAGVLHLDFSPGNILWEEQGGVYHFSLVDTNRMHFGHVGLRRGCANFARLWGSVAFFRILAREYAKARGFDEERCVVEVKRARDRFWHRYSRRHKVRYPLEY